MTSEASVDEFGARFRRVTPLTWFLLLGAMGSLVVGWVAPGTSYVLLCVSIAFSGAALLCGVAGRRRGETDVDRDSRHDPALEADERWDRVLAASRAGEEEPGASVSQTTFGDTSVDLREVGAELNAQLRAEFDALRAELWQQGKDREAAVLERVEELARRPGDLREAPSSPAGPAVDGQPPSTAGDRRLEEAITRLGEVVRSMGTLAEIEVVIETSIRELRSAIASVSERMDDLPLALRARLDDSLLHQRVEGLASLEGSAREIRTAVAALSDHVRSIEAVLQTSTREQAELAAEVTTLKDEVARLTKRVPVRPKPVRLEDGQIEALVAALVEKTPRSAIASKARDVAERGVLKTTGERAPTDKQATSRLKKAAATSAVAPTTAGTKATEPRRGEPATPS